MIYIVDDDITVRKSLAMVLENEGLPVATFDSAEAFLEADLPSCRACAIVDMYLPGMNGLDLQQHLISRHIVLPLVFLTGHGEIPTSVAAMKSGAEDYLIKPISAERLLPVVQSALAKSQSMQENARRRHEARLRVEGLTHREREIMQLSARGYSAKEIARQLNISFRTVEKHKSSLLQKTGAKNMLDAQSLLWDSGEADRDRRNTASTSSSD
ncbi:response regulator [Methylomonas sp. SURF-2]|uniref:Response regulator n=1 Tax=Methylomonas subterranea TaxID=2952225 RepID=A0ABT1TE71_9GAMM|nr:response regulator [Methylomonas sp. SURF-2]MCQ8103761.1 response regulator [Methylomonas sp. SURF-2]